jgi:chromate transporter
VLPLLQELTVQPGWVSADEFLAGYGAAQAAPGPLFTFAALLGAASHHEPAGWTGAALATLAIFLPSFFYVIGALPLWEGLRHHPGMQKAMLAIDAAVVGLLLAAFYNPVWTGAIHSARDFALAGIAYLALTFWKWPPWLVVLLCAAATGFGWR